MSNPNGRVTHGHTKGGKPSRTLLSWRAMMARCYNENSEKYVRYGGRGIRVCQRWHTFENFLADMGLRPDGMTLDRRDNDQDYDPDNCRWATPIVQANNRETYRSGWKRENENCPSGHPYSGNNLSFKKDGARKCKACDRERARAYRARKAP